MTPRRARLGACCTALLLILALTAFMAGDALEVVHPVEEAATAEDCHAENAGRVHPQSASLVGWDCSEWPSDHPLHYCAHTVVSAAAASSTRARVEEPRGSDCPLRVQPQATVATDEISLRGPPFLSI